LAELKSRSENLQTAMDMLATGMILLGANGRILSLNRAAAQLLAGNDGLLATHGRLRTESVAETTILENLITQARATAAGKGLSPAGAMVVSRRALPPLHVLVTPARNIDFDARDPVLAIAFVTDPSQRIRPAAEIVRVLFGLTAAESRVALLLGDGHAPPAIVDLIGVSANTVKTQLASIYRKTGTTRQSQLVRLLTQLASTTSKT